MKQFGRFLSGFVSIAFIAGTLWGITHVQDIRDWWALRGYQPPQRIVQLADKTTMQPGARKLFYVNQPQLNDKPSFRDNCPAFEQSIVLGCYVSNKGIFMLDVKDPRLSGIIEVTAAHELLHAAYERLSGKERREVDRMTSTFFAQLNDQRVKDTVERYRAKEPDVVPNELHSILASEVRELSPELETYYSKYFADRKQIVNFSEKYEQTFVDLENQVKSYDVRLAKLKKQIESNQAELERQSEEVDRERKRLDSLLRSNQTEAYNAAVPGFNSLVNRYNDLIKTTKALIEQYNSLVEERNAIATTEQELIEAINSKAQTKETE